MKGLVLREGLHDIFVAQISSQSAMTCNHRNMHLISHFQNEQTMVGLINTDVLISPVFTDHLVKEELLLLILTFSIQISSKLPPKRQVLQYHRNFLKRREIIYIHNDMITNAFLNLKFPHNKEDYFYGK